MNNYFLYPHNFQLESGRELENLQIAYTTCGNPNAEKTIWVCHALTGNAQVMDWWSGLFGDGALFNPYEYRIVCANVVGSCYGSTGPGNYEVPLDFPLITIRDMANAHAILREYLGIEAIDILIGASLGGQQALEWAIQETDRIKSLILIATNAMHSPFGKAFNEAQRMALKADQSFGQSGGGFEGLKAARALAMLSYRSYTDFSIKQNDFDAVEKIDGFKASSYLSYQGEKFKGRFDPHAYYFLTKAMDSHNVGRGRGAIKTALQKITARTLVVGVNSDVLFPYCEQEFLAKHIPNAELGTIESSHGHDAFLIEYRQLEILINEFLYNGFKNFKPTTLKRKTNV